MRQYISKITKTIIISLFITTTPVLADDFTITHHDINRTLGAVNFSEVTVGDSSDIVIDFYNDELLDILDNCATYPPSNTAFSIVSQTCGDWTGSRIPDPYSVHLETDSGSSCSATVRYTPLAAGEDNDNFSLYCNDSSYDGNTRPSFYIDLSGTATGVETSTWITLPANIDSQWLSSGGQSISHSGNPQFKFSVSQSTSILIDLNSSVDTYLYLLNDENTIIASNNDSNRTLNSQLLMTLSTGTYTIVAATYQPGNSADFNLSVSENNQPATFVKATGDGEAFCPVNHHIASKQDVEQNQDAARTQLQTWDIARLANGWALRGSGYGFDFTFETVTLGHTLCIED